MLQKKSKLCDIKSDFFIALMLYRWSKKFQNASNKEPTFFLSRRIDPSSGVQKASLHSEHSHTGAISPSQQTWLDEIAFHGALPPRACNRCWWNCPRGPSDVTLKNPTLVNSGHFVLERIDSCLIDSPQTSVISTPQVLFTVRFWSLRWRDTLMSSFAKQQEP